MSKEPKQEPSIVGENPTVGEHSANVSLMGTSYVLHKFNVSFIPRSEREMLFWLAQYVNTARTYRLDFPAVFNASDYRFSFHVLEALFQRVQEAFASLDTLPGVLRAVTAWKNILLYNRSHDPVPAPRPERDMLPPTDAARTGLLSIIVEQVRLLRQQPNFNEAIGRQFGIIPTPAPAPDPATLNPNASARFTGGLVELSFRSPNGIRGVEFAEIRCDRGDGHVHLVGMTTHARFTDHHDLPAAGARANWVYHLCYVDRSGNFVGQESIVDVTVQGRSHQM